MKKKVLFICVILILVTLAIIFIYNHYNKIDIYINTNLFAAKIDKILNDSKEYDGKRVSISGFIHYDESGNCYIARNFVGSSGAALVGLLLKGEYESFIESDWVKVEGTIRYKFTDYKEGTKVPYIDIYKIYKVKQQKNDEFVVT